MKTKKQVVKVSEQIWEERDVTEPDVESVKQMDARIKRVVCVAVSVAALVLFISVVVAVALIIISEVKGPAL